MTVIRLIFPAGKDKWNRAKQNFDQLIEQNITIVWDHEAPSTDPEVPLTAGTPADRARQLWQALTEQKSCTVWAARGGDGCSDLLPLIDWKQLKNYPKKTLMGFSDISSLLWCLQFQANWPVLHGPMLATKNWNFEQLCTRKAIELISGTDTSSFSLALKPLNSSAHKLPTLEGTFAGGCFSVLTNLIGTPYFPRTLAGHILFFEDIGERAGSLLRYFNQWLQSGALTAVKGIILGQFLFPSSEEISEERFKEIISKKWSGPVYSSRDFGHSQPNFPIPLGPYGRIQGDRWHLDFDHLAKDGGR